MNNAKGLLPRLPFYLFVAVVLAACGGGGGGDSGGGGGGDIVRPQCQAPAPLNPGNTNYGFLFPSVDFSSGQITLIDADNLGSKQKLSPNGVATPGSVAVAQSGIFQAAANGDPAIVKGLKPAALVYVNDGDVYRVDLDKNGAGTGPVKLTDVGNINTVCDTSIVTVKIDDATSDYYLYSVPAAGENCNTGDSAQNLASLVMINPASTSQPPRPVDNAKPVEVLADPGTGTLVSIIALDDGGHLNVYDDQYTNPAQVVVDTFRTVKDLYHALNIAFVLVDSNSFGWEIVRIEADSGGSLKQPGILPLDSGEQVTAVAADDAYLYYALQSSSGYSISRVALDDPGTTLTPKVVLPFTGQAGDYVADLQVSGGHLVFGVVSGKETVGTLYSADKDSNGSAQSLDNNVAFAYPFFTANGRLYYTVISGGELRARIATDTGSLINDYDRSAWFSSMLPQNRQAGTVDPAQVLLAAGYTGSGQTLSGAVLDSFPTASNAACVTFNKGVGGQPVVLQHFNSLGTGFVTSGDGSEQARFAFDASDGRFVTVP